MRIVRGWSLFFLPLGYSNLQKKKKMPKLLQGIITVIDVFYQYATQHGEYDMLNKAELKELLENEFHQILKVRTPCQDGIMQEFSSLSLSTFLSHMSNILEDSSYLVIENRVW